MGINVAAETYQSSILKARDYKTQGNFEKAIAEYKKALSQRKGRDIEVMINIATLYRYLRKYDESAAWLEKVLEIDPNNREALEDLKRLKLNRGIHIIGNYGGWEIDYTKKQKDIQIFLGSIPWLDLYFGYSDFEKILYTRTKFFGKAYIFVNPKTYLKIEFNEKNYDYPFYKISQPDDNAYDKLNSIEFEIYHSISPNYSFSLNYERFNPNFYWDPQAKASNYKIGAEFNAKFFKILQGTIFIHRIKDPNPTKLIVDHKNKKVLAFDYKTDYFIGGGIELESNPFEVGLKYIPNRDLDNTLDYSYFIKAAYKINEGRLKFPLKVRMDYLYDKYNILSYMKGQASKVYMFTINAEPLKYLIINTGIKFLRRPDIKETGFFIGFVYKQAI